MADIDYPAIYRGTRERIDGLVRDLPVEVLDRAAPATPEWSVRDIVAHLAGCAADLLVGNLDGLAGDAWTQAQVDARGGREIGDVLDEWHRCGEVVDGMLEDLDPMLRLMALTDAVTHEHDIRGAEGAPGARGSDAVEFGFESVSRGIGAQRGASGALRIVHEAGESVVGPGDPSATLRTTRFEVLRAGVGRRSYEQIAAWDWQGDALPETMVLGMFSPPCTSPLDE